MLVLIPGQALGKADQCDECVRRRRNSQQKESGTQGLSTPRARDLSAQCHRMSQSLLVTNRVAIPQLPVTDYLCLHGLYLTSQSMFEKFVLINFISAVAAADLEICSGQTSTQTTCDKGPRRTPRAHMSLGAGKELG